MMERLMLLAFLATVALCHEPFQVIFEWKSIDFEWPSDEERQYAITRGDYIPANNFITTVKFWKDKMYLTLPRWKDGVPVTLSVTSAKPINGITAPKLEAFPNWPMQKLGDCTAFQLVHSIEIDPKGRMWVLDTGRPTSLRESKADCSPRLVILDLENNGKILRSYQFPEHVARRTNAYLNDIVLNHEDGGIAYITDTGTTDPGIIVYSLKDNNSWKVRHDSMKAKSEAVGFMVAKTHVINPVHVDGIALSPASSRDRQVYYSPLSSFHLYSIPVSALKNNVTNIDRYVRELGRKSSQTDGMAMSSTGVLYFGLLADDAISMWDTKNIASFTVGQRVISRDHVLTQWPDSFAFDDDGNFWCVTNMLQNFLNNRVDINVPNYRLIRSRVGVKNYQYYENGTAPELPDFTAGADSVRLVLAALLPTILILIAK
ncbi:protein yellow-like [Temnothorax curvispinosus]|uniref:Protein yellow-like n=1 Tax=Temnothorax curvispinosus TaxID=300111 RepID=A0A6J1R2R6_9HYME|nr:protein yellow-like [Temnothorax curvispinosus]XP_024867453.1 protein yellow-like [Temnothorax curvispinosus]XP_024867454.1 protein yellow-like [Temnothorax curvispinosus]XP_024887370.1 protein yellow-like [Temnothorax curvispinosus]XP_024887371.1 protein yellow-like [Temnothorax curvispinosus]